MISATATVAPRYLSRKSCRAQREGAVWYGDAVRCQGACGGAGCYYQLNSWLAAWCTAKFPFPTPPVPPHTHTPPHTRTHLHHTKAPLRAQQARLVAQRVAKRRPQQLALPRGAAVECHALGVAAQPSLHRRRQAGGRRGGGMRGQRGRVGRADCSSGSPAQPTRRAPTPAPAPTPTPTHTTHVQRAVGSLQRLLPLEEAAKVGGRACHEGPHAKHIGQDGARVAVRPAVPPAGPGAGWRGWVWVWVWGWGWGRGRAISEKLKHLVPLLANQHRESLL